MAYTPQTWTDGAGGGTPINAARLAVIEAGLQTLAADPLLIGAAFSLHPGITDSTARAMSNANEAVYVRCWGAGTFSSVAFRPSVQSGNICAGIYTNVVVGGVNQPGNRVATTGSVACPATSAPATAIALDNSVTVTHGSHWFAFAADNVTATFVMTPTLPLSDTVLAPGVAYAQGTAFPLPSSASSLTAGLRRIPLIRGV